MNRGHLANHHQKGFTLVELVVVLIIIGIISAIALPRFFDAQRFDDRGFYTEVINAVRYAQQHAVATNCDVQVTLTANGYSLERRTNNCTGGFTAPVLSPASPGTNFTGNKPGVNIAPVMTFSFSPLGVPSVGNTDISVSSNSFRINGVTGYIEEL